MFTIGLVTVVFCYGYRYLDGSHCFDKICCILGTFAKLLYRYLNEVPEVLC